MIVVDSSVWIDVLRDKKTPEAERFFAFEDLNVIITGDLILLEVLRGTQNDKHSENVRRRMERFPVVTMLDRNLAIESAKNYRLLRGRGIQVRKTADLIHWHLLHRAPSQPATAGQGFPPHGGISRPATCLISQRSSAHARTEAIAPCRPVTKSPPADGY